MDEKIFKVNVNTIANAKEEYKLHNSTIQEKLKNILNEINRIDEIYYTKTALEYQNQVSKFLDKTIESVNNDNNYFNALFDDIISTYNELHSDVKNSVGKENDEV